jgi:hypothetical protein
MKKKKIDPEVQKKEMMETECKEILSRKALGILPLNPTRIFAIDERVQWGNMQETYIRQIFEGGLYYIIESLNVKRNRDFPAENEIRYAEWIEIYKYDQNKSTIFTQPEEYRLTFLNAGINSLLNMVYHAGVDFNVDYQRDHVWNLVDKIALIDSIFNNIDIGKFTFVQRSFSHNGKLYEILDGKQRLTAICEFVEGRFPYKGVYFAELSFRDKNKIENHGIAWGYLENPSRKAIFETFIKLNTCGRPMENKDIQKVKKLLNELK